MSTAWLVLRDGRTFRGRSLGAVGEGSGEVIFNTAMQGYQEILTDPSYRGQIVAMTYPMIGNYGVNDEDVESRRPWVNGFIVKEASPIASNFRAGASLDEYLGRHGIVGIQDIDTRALTRHLRDHGAQDGIVSSVETDPRRLLDRARALPGLVGRDLVAEVTAATPYAWSEGGWELARGYVPPPAPRFTVVAYDCGIKFNILRQLRAIGCDVTVVPASTSTADVLARKPDGVFLSNGPGREGRDHRAEPRLRRRAGVGDGARMGADAPQPQRRYLRRPPAPRVAGLLRAVPPRGLARPSRCQLPLPPFHGLDGSEGRLTASCPNT